MMAVVRMKAVADAPELNYTEKKNSFPLSAFVSFLFLYFFGTYISFEVTGSAIHGEAHSDAGPSGRAPVVLDRGFESRSRHGCMSAVFCVVPSSLTFLSFAAGPNALKG